MRRKTLALAFVAVVSLLLIQNTIIPAIFAQDSTPVPSAPLSTSTPAPYTLIFQNEPGPDVPTLQELANGATTDEAIIQNVVAYYEANRDQLAVFWREDNLTRLAGIFAMYVTHISLPYGETPSPASIAEFITQERAHCGTYIVPQVTIVTALGLSWRTVEFVGEHAFVEIYVDDHWELFDATTNTWINHSAVDLLKRVEREYRYFYTPMLDINHPEARLHIAEGYNMQTLRSRMPTMGIVYMPPGQMIVSLPSGPLVAQIST